MTAAALVLLLTGHFIGDFLLQSDRMAQGKSRSWSILVEHGVVYTGAVMVFMAMTGPGWTLTQAGTFAALTCALHVAQDALTSRLTARLWFFEREDGIWAQAHYARPRHGRELVNPWRLVSERRHWFFVAIGADQLLHVYALAGAWWWVMR